MLYGLRYSAGKWRLEVPVAPSQASVYPSLPWSCPGQLSTLAGAPKDPSVPEFTWHGAVCSAPVQPAKAADEHTLMPEDCHLTSWAHVPGERTAPVLAGTCRRFPPGAQRSAAESAAVKVVSDVLASSHPSKHFCCFSALLRTRMAQRGGVQGGRTEGGGAHPLPQIHPRVEHSQRMAPNWI